MVTIERSVKERGAEAGMSRFYGWHAPLHPFNVAILAFDMFESFMVAGPSFIILLFMIYDLWRQSPTRPRSSMLPAESAAHIVRALCLAIAFIPLCCSEQCSAILTSAILNGKL